MRHHDSDFTELALRSNLVRQPPPEGFTERVMAEIRRGSRPAEPAWRRWFSRKPVPRFTWVLGGCAAAALALLAILPDPTAGPGRGGDEAAPGYAMPPALAVGQGTPASHLHEHDLAEVLHLAGQKWNQAQLAAFPSRLDYRP